MTAEAGVTWRPQIGFCLETQRPAQSAGEATVVLLDRLRAGDRSAIDILVSRYQAPLRRWAHGRLPPWARSLCDTEDLVQETLLATLRRLGDFEVRKDGALHAYLRQSLLNRVRDEIRRVSRRPLHQEADEEQLFDGSPSPLESVLGKEALARYESALEKLSPAERDAVVARVELGLSYAEIAAANGKSSPDAVRMMVGRALLRLAREMGHG